MSKKYEVGYGKPPNHSKFKKGQTGNPKGRPMGSRNFSTDAKAVLKLPVRTTLGGKRKTVSTQHAALLRLREKALSGDARALDGLLGLARNYNDEAFAQVAAALTATDQEIIDAFKRRVRREDGELPSDDDQDAIDGTCGNADKANDNDETPDEEDDNDWLR